MNFKIISTTGFQKQFDNLGLKYQFLIREKTNLIKQNPSRFKALKYPGHKLFRVPLNFNSKEMRLIYKIIEPNIILLCLLKRKHDYKDLKKYLKNI